MRPIRIVIFAKAPQPGFAKTRLIPALGAQGAADLALRLLMHTVHESLAAKVGTVELCVTPLSNNAVWRSLCLPAKLVWSDQGEGDLGERLARAAQRTVLSGESVLLIGTDCPALSAALLKQAADELRLMDSTLFATSDGGYALLGLNRFHSSIFSGITWSTDTVAYETLCRLGTLGWTVQTHPALHDIDEPADLKWLPQNWQEELNEFP